jgi:hypothetical protein
LRNGRVDYRLGYYLTRDIVFALHLALGRCESGLRYIRYSCESANQADDGRPSPLSPTLSEQRVAAELRAADNKLMATQVRGRPKADGFAVSKLLYSAADFKTSAPSLRK